MQYSKQLGFIQVELHRITKINEDPRADISEKLLTDLITLLAKYEIVTDHFTFDFSSSEKCEQRDILHLALIKAGMRIEKENQLLQENV
ncbi:hypothetical protein [Lysinibacillus boronitolerans]|uniref:Uncharacterized protein n=1 Tax=Lysinibacillus boronitolerans JCM 21713 = 10a = NBRC 103108 TaxID=1294264 RepID=A0ABR4XX80_9BACI|nr:hypothetical protein [Lysinibacillus boronitolerans]KGR83652.1 hypothetical protein CD31_15685 [Lysinibacillus boronitolerans JCM 21713 = 10a = NBRC 103108]